MPNRYVNQPTDFGDSKKNNDLLRFLLENSGENQGRKVCAAVPERQGPDVQAGVANVNDLQRHAFGRKHAQPLIIQ